MSSTGAVEEVALCCACGVAAGVCFGLMHASMEMAWFLFLRHLHHLRLIHRLSPHFPATRTRPFKQDFFAVSISPMLLAAWMCARRDTYYRNCRTSLDVAGGLSFTWSIMVVHDAYFWVIHTCMHRIRPLYRKVHQLHHSIGGDITVFSTAYGEVLDVALSITPFYSLVMYWVYISGEWNPFHFALATFAVNNVDMMGHCGYDLPAWLYGPASLGVLFTPLAQRPLHHYIHHLDPRFNRSLYFTWWDRFGHTYRDTHPKICSIC